MNVVFLSDRLSVRGGADKHLLQVVDWAGGAGARVTMAVGRDEGETELPSGATVVTLKGLASATATGARLRGLDELLAGADLVHVQNVMNPVALAAATAAGKTVVTVQDHRVFCPGMGRTIPDGSRCDLRMGDEACAGCLPDAAYRQRLLELTAARRNAVAGARLIVLSRYMARELASAGMGPAAVVPPWVEVGNEPVSAGSGFLLGGRLVRHKGVLDGWRAWEMAATGESLRVAGAGPLADRLDGARILGWLGSAALRRELRAARALLFPSRWQEPLGILGIEALAAGTPVIVAATGGTEEWHHRGCIVVPPGDVGAMAEAMDRLAGDPPLAQGLGEEGREMVAARFARPAIEESLQEVYETVAVTKSTPRRSPA